VDCTRGADMVGEPSTDFVWYNPRSPVCVGLPAPVHVLIQRLTEENAT
jgi:hypothetical protein